MRFIVVLPFLLLAACKMDPTGGSAAEQGAEASAEPAVTTADALAAHDPQPGAPADPAAGDDQPRPVMQMQVVLDRVGFTPGVVDGKEGLSTRNAVAGFQEAKGLPVTGALDDATRQALAGWSNIPATRVVTIPAAFAAGPFQPIPPKPEDQAKLPALGYGSLEEKLAERFHTTPETLRLLNPGVVSFQAGQQLRVPNVGGDRIDEGAVSDARWRDTLATLGVGSAQPQATRIVVSKAGETLKAYDAQGRLIAMYTATMGSSHDPLPIGRWKVTGVARNPDFSFDPELFWDVPDNKAKQRLPPGPNGPVGVAWIDLDREHYGIHGTPEPQTIGRAESHGCVRLTNWDVARLAQMVKPGTQVLFEP